MVTRRRFLEAATAAGVAPILVPRLAGARPRRSGPPPGGAPPVVVPSGAKVPVDDRGDAKVVHLTAAELEHEFAPGLTARCWGYNGHVNGPVIELREGDHVRIYVTNRLPAPTTVHWHGLILPNGMDGVSGLTQPPIPPGETWRYEFDLVQHGTFMFHSHHDTMTQEGMGLTGMLVIHPRHPREPRADRDFALLLHEWRIDAGAARPNPNEMSDFNVLTINGRVFPFLDPLVVRTGQRVRLRIGNLSAMSHHPIHVHGHEFEVTATDGQTVREDQRHKRVTTMVGVGETRDIEFVAEYPGDWAFHCHMTHHVMNQMGHAFPNMIGFEKDGFDARMRRLIPGYATMGTTGMKDMTDMDMPLPKNSIPMLNGRGGFDAAISLGGMAGVLKVRDAVTADALDRNADPGWYEHPDGTVARPASPEELRADGVDPAPRAAATPVDHATSRRR